MRLQNAQFCQIRLENRPRGIYFAVGAQRSFPALAERDPCLSHNGPVVEPSAALMLSIWIRGMVQSRLGTPADSGEREFALVAKVNLRLFSFVIN
jgi:hypothetical protein